MNRHAQNVPTWRAPVGRDPYVTRRSAVPQLVPRVDPVVYGSTDGPLSGTQLQSFDADGYLVLSDRLPAPDARSALEETREAVTRQAVPLQLERGGIGVRSAYEVHRAGPVLASICEHPLLVGAARQVLGSEVSLFQSRVDFRTLEGTGFYWRSDFEGWHVDAGLPTMRALTAWVLLARGFEGDRPLLVVPGSHRTFAPCPDPAHDRVDASIRRPEPVLPRSALQWLVDDRGIRALQVEPGTVVLLDSNLLHATPANLSPHAGASLFVAFNSVENALTAPSGAQGPHPA